MLAGVAWSLHGETTFSFSAGLATAGFLRLAPSRPTAPQCLPSGNPCNLAPPIPLPVPPPPRPVTHLKIEVGVGEVFVQRRRKVLRRGHDDAERSAERTRQCHTPLAGTDGKAGLAAVLQPARLIGIIWWGGKPRALFGKA